VNPIDPEVLALLRKARGNLAAADVRGLLAPLEQRVERWHREPQAFPGRKAWAEECRELLTRRAELALLLQVIESEGEEDGMIDPEAIDREIVRRLISDGSPGEFRWLIGETLATAARCESEADTAAARMEGTTDWHRSGVGNVARFLEIIPEHIRNRRTNQERARRLRLAVAASLARLAGLAGPSLGDLAELRVCLKEALCLAAGEDAELAARRSDLAGVERTMSRVGLAAATVAKAAKTIGVGRIAADLLGQRESLSASISAREKLLIGDADRRAGEIVVKATAGDVGSLTELCEWAIRQPAAFAPDLALNIRSAFADSIAPDASLFLSIL
jgi:hypothetical protein